MIGIVLSRADSASEHIGEHLLAATDWTTELDDSVPDGDGGATVYRTDGFELREFDDLHLSLEDVAARFSGAPDLLVFASRHSGDSGQLLTAHYPGNFGPADHGGEPNELARACPNALDRVLAELTERAPPGYDVGMECTHHGPSTVGAPSMFVEVGSDQPQWDDPEAARAVAEAILALRGVEADRPPETDGKTVRGPARRHLVGFGDGHYAPRFGRLAAETDWAVGHVAADWALEEMADPAARRGLLEQAFERSAASVAVVEGAYPELLEELDRLGYRVVSETWVRAVDGVALPLVDRLETALEPVEEGLRFGEPARTGATDPSFEVVSLPEEAIAEAAGIDSEATRAALTEHALAFETSEGGNRIEGRAALGSPDDYEAFIDGIHSLLERKYDDVEREDGQLVATRTAFDPEKASVLGVPQGPKFGRLAEGDSVTVDGETIPPERVRSERIRRFDV